MKQSINFSQFCDAFRDMNRGDNFSYDGLRVLFDYIEDLDDQCDTDTELDVIAFCCEFSEYDSAKECAVDIYGFTLNTEDYDAEEQEDTALEYLQDNTLVIRFDSGIIIQDF